MKVLLENNKFLGSAARGWLSGRVLFSRSRGFGFESHWRHCVESLSLA